MYADKLLDEKDMEQFNKIKFSIAKDNFDVCIALHKYSLVTRLALLALTNLPMTVQLV